MAGRRFIFLCVLLIVAVQTSRVYSEPVLAPELLKLLNLPAISSQLRNILGQGSGGYGDLTSMAQSMSITNSGATDKQETVGASSFLKLLSP